MKFPDPETKISVLRRYLHVLSLLQNSKDRWNAGKLAEYLSEDEKAVSPGRDRGGISDKSVRDYIDDLRNEYGIDIKSGRGVRQQRLVKPLTDEQQAFIAELYTSFVTRDTSRELILGDLIRTQKDSALWLLARLHFAILNRNIIKFKYTANTRKEAKEYRVHPYHLVIRNHNLYLVAFNEGIRVTATYIASKIRDLAVLDIKYPGDVPTVDEYYKDTLAFKGKRMQFRIRFTQKCAPQVNQIIAILNPTVKVLKKDELYEASFWSTDENYLCKELFMYGKEVEIVEPKEIRKMMVEMLDETIGVYKKK